MFRRMITHAHTLSRLIAVIRNWPLYFLNRLQWVKGDRVVYRLRNGMELHCRPYPIDRCPMNDVWLDRNYDPATFGVPFDWSACRTIMDIGMNIGMFTLFAAKYAPQATIHSFEPEPGNFAVAHENIQANRLENRVKPQQTAVGGQKGELTLYVVQNGSGGHSLFHYTDKSTAITVPVIPLKDVMDALSITVCDYMKIDCEGAEYDILYALPSEYFRRIRFIGLEYHYFSKDPRHTPEELKKHLATQGFRIVDTKNSMLFAINDRL